MICHSSIGRRKSVLLKQHLLNLTILQANTLEQVLSDSPTDPEITKLPALVLEMQTKDVNYKSFYQNLKNFIIENSSVKMETISSSTGVDDLEQNEQTVQEQARELKFYLNLLKKKIFSNDYASNPIQSASLMNTGNQITNLKGDIQTVDIQDSFLESIPPHFRSFFTAPSPQAQLISNSFEGGYGPFAYFLTYQKLAKYEFLQSVDQSGSENWVTLTTSSASNIGANQKLLCRVSPIQDNTLGFKTDESTPVINKYFMLG